MPGCYILNLVTFGPVVSEEKSFESVDGRRTDDGGFPSYKFPGAFGSGELKILAVGRTGGGCVARVSDFFFFQKNPSQKKKCFLFEGVKVREDRLE